MVSDFLTIKKDLPNLGVGLGFREPLAEAISANAQAIDFLELITDHFLNEGPVETGILDQLSDFVLVPHGLELSIGNMDELDKDYLLRLQKLFERIRAPWWSDHLCFTGVRQNRVHDLLPLPYSREALEHVVARIRQIQSIVQLPFLLENISTYVQLPGADFSEAQFIGEVLEQADCGMLLDVNNVYVNAFNHGFDPFAYIDQLPLQRVVQVHIAGHRRAGSVIIDNHGAKIVKPVYDLLEYALRKTEVRAISLERDQLFPRFSSILSELAKIRDIKGLTELGCQGVRAAQL